VTVTWSTIVINCTVNRLVAPLRVLVVPLRVLVVPLRVLVVPLRVEGLRDQNIRIRSMRGVILKENVMDAGGRIILRRNVHSGRKSICSILVRKKFKKLNTILRSNPLLYPSRSTAIKLWRWRIAVRVQIFSKTKWLSVHLYVLS
jgi:hypothetical protein